MNARQAALRAAKLVDEVTKQNTELASMNANQAADIKAYNNVILAMIGGESPCPWCEEEKECKLEAKGGKGCQEWWLKWPERGDADDSQGVHASSQEG